jgi:hypothetical protein
MTKLREHLRRYTDIPALIYLLREKKITLLDPETWDDKNDSYFLRLYREKKNLGSVLALCFTQVTETYHHWRVFANGSSGVCISFRRKQLLEALRRQPGLRSEPVKYVKLNDMRKKRLHMEKLPFLKRYPFEHESEFRIIYESRDDLRAFDVPVPLSCIERITLSPWLHSSLSDHVKKILWAISGCRDLEIARSTLISNEEWKSFGESSIYGKPPKGRK